MATSSYPDDSTNKNVSFAFLQLCSLYQLLYCLYNRCSSINVSFDYHSYIGAYTTRLPKLLQGIFSFCRIDTDMSEITKYRKTGNQVVLCPEIFLRVAEEVVATNPEGIKILLLVSKSFHALLKTYEKSICATLLKTDYTFSWCNANEEVVISSRMPFGTMSVKKFTFPWAAEMYCRAETIDYLANHEITDTIDHVGESWPHLSEIPLEIPRRLEMLKRRSFSLLYRLADCTSGLTSTREIRSYQAEFLESLTSAELASLGVLVEIMGQNYFNLTKNAIASSNSSNTSTTRLPPQEWFFTPSAYRAEEPSNDHWIRECMCVFEDLTQRYGPHFPYVFLVGGKDKLLRPDLWAQTMLQEGLDNMNAFELGYTMSYASLQSVVWKVFCRRESCSLQDSWSVAKEIVEGEMRSYRLELGF